MIIKDNKAIFSSFVKNNDLKFVYVDIGARGDISSPWTELENDSYIIGFEPDSVEAKRLNSCFNNRKYFDIALWSKKCNKKVYINEWESTSSMYKPNMNFISKFLPKHWEGRKPKIVVDVECNTLDDVLLNSGIIPDFIKIDTQGAELEILKGSEEILKKYFPMVTCETWCAEVYKDAPMMHEVIEYMDSLDYQVFDMELAAAWKHGKDNVYCKQKSIGYEILLVKKLNSLDIENEEIFVKFLLLLELYGYRDYAIYLSESFDFSKKNELLDIFNKNNFNDKKFLTRINNKIKRKLFGYKIFPNIKY